MIHATFEIDEWDEAPVDDSEPKVTRVDGTKQFSGDLKGGARIQYVMVYGEGGGAALVAIERIDATVGDRTGALVLRHVGGFEDGAATAELDVLADFGTGDFASVTGRGSMRADPSGTMDLDLDLDQ